MLNQLKTPLDILFSLFKNVPLRLLLLLLFFVVLIVLIVVIGPLFGFQPPSWFFPAYTLPATFRTPIAPFKLNTPFVEKDHLVQGLRQAFESRACGVHVYWAPNNAGKTTYIRHVAELVRQNSSSVEGVRVIDLNFLTPSSHVKDMWSWLARALQLEASTQSLSALLSPSRFFQFVCGVSGDDRRHYVLVLDQFDEVVRRYSSGRNDLHGFVQGLATESVNNKRFSVILVVQDPVLARDLLRFNGGSKIRRIGTPAILKWGRNEVDRYLAITAQAPYAPPPPQQQQQQQQLQQELTPVEDTFKLSAEAQLRTIAELATRAAVPGFLVDLPHHSEVNVTLVTEAANYAAQQWAQGESIFFGK